MEPLLPPPGTLSPKGTWRTYTTAEGLAGLQTEHLAEDAEGYLWIGTWADGACRFDGDEFRTFTTRDGLPSNLVYATLLDRQGKLWLGTGGGACWYDGRTFHRFGEERGIGDQAVSFLFEDRQGRLWMGGKEVLGYCEDMEYCDLLPEYRRQYGAGPGGEGYDECRGIAQDREGNLWFSLFWVLIRWSGAGFQRYGQEEGLAAGDAVCQGSDGDLWVWSGEQVWRYGGQGFQPVAVKSGTRIRKIQNDREGRTWFCTAGGGVLYYDGTQFQRFTEQDGLAFNVVNAIHQDREGLLWFATWGGGLSCYDPHGLQVFGEGEGLGHNWQATLVEDCQGRIWAGKNKTIARYDGEDFTFFGEAEGLDLGEGFALCEDRTGQLWLGGRHGLVRYDGQQFQRIGTEEGFGEFGVSAIAEDQHGQLFLGHWEKTFGELEYRKNPLRITRYDGQSFHTLFRIAQEESNVCWVSAILAGRNRELYFALSNVNFYFGPGRGIGRWHETEGVVFYTTADGLVSNNVEDLLQDRQGNLWAATPEGLSRFDGTHFQNFTPEHGLSSKQIHCICEDRQGRLWFGTDRGVTCYDGQTFQVIHSKDLHSVTGILEDRQGRFWFATRKGMAIYRPHQIPPRIRILQVNADPVHGQAQEVEVFDSIRQVLFEYKGLSFRTHPKDMLYTCRLQGYEEEWQKPTREMRAFYRDLPMGEYTFEVRAIDRDLNYSEPASVHLKVIPDLRDQRIDELEQRVRERTQELEAQNRALEQANVQIQQANQHKSQFLSRMSYDLRTPMNAILGYTRILLRKTQGLLDQRQYQNLQNIQLSADQLLVLINDILDLSRVEAGRIELKPEQVALKQLVQECAAAVASLLRPGVELRQQLAEVAPLYTDPDRLRRVLMNLLSNAVKFTEQGHITVSVQSAEGWVELSVADTGVGIPAEDLPHIFEEFRQVDRQGHRPEGSGLGLAIARKSVELLGGSISVESTVGRGTTFTLRLKDCEDP